MLSKEVMGVLALAILWVNTLLIAGAAAKQIGGLLALKRRLADGLVRGEITRGDGPDGALAVHRVEQTGRGGGDEQTIQFADRSYAGQVFGGAIALHGGGTVAIAPADEAEVWLDADALAEAAACASDAAFDQAFEQARKARGFARTIEASLREGREVFVHTRGAGVLVATIDPRPWLSRKIALGVAFIAGDVLVAAACTAVALRPPHFGLVSTIGGALCLAFFLMIQPAGTMLRDAILPPSRASVRGRWARSAPKLSAGRASVASSEAP